MVLGVSVVYFKRKLLRTVMVSFDTLHNLFFAKKKKQKKKTHAFWGLVPSKIINLC